LPRAVWSSMCLAAATRFWRLLICYLFPFIIAFSKYDEPVMSEAAQARLAVYSRVWFRLIIPLM
jgi:hypothetical protein